MVCPQWILKLISSYVGIIQIRFMGRSWLLPLSLPTSSPVIIIKFSFFSVSISTLQSIFYNLLANNSTNYFILFINYFKSKNITTLLHNFKLFSEIFYKFLCFIIGIRQYCCLLTVPRIFQVMNYNGYFTKFFIYNSMKLQISFNLRNHI